MGAYQLASEETEDNINLSHLHDDIGKTFTYILLPTKWLRESFFDMIKLWIPFLLFVFDFGVFFI